MIIIIACPRMVNIYKTKQNRMEWDGPLGVCKFNIYHWFLVSNQVIYFVLYSISLIKFCYDIFYLLDFSVVLFFSPKQTQSPPPSDTLHEYYKNMYLKKKKSHNLLAKLNSFRAWVMSPGLRGSMHIYRITWTGTNKLLPKAITMCRKNCDFFFSLWLSKIKG